MSLTETFSYDKEGRIERFPLLKKLFLAMVIILTALLSFNIGRLSATKNKEPIRIEYDPSLIQDEIQNSSTSQVNNSASVINAVQSQTVETGEVVVSKNGSKYHYSYCPGAKQIKEENKIVFKTPAAAETAGYTLANNCRPR